MRPGIAIALRATTGAAAVAALVAAGWLGWDAIARRPITAVRFTGETQRVPAAELDRLAAGLRGRESREVALSAVREAVKRVPWVRDCAVRSLFPGTLEIAIESHEVLARWGEAHLVSVRGEVFAAEHDGELPRFTGPEGSAPEIAAAWRGIVAAAAPIAIPVVELRLSARRAWQAKLASGLDIDLGRTQVEQRLARFAAAWPQVSQEAASATHADLRYPNGFALRGVPQPDRKPGAKARKA
jgi:cell division protein FtsQ